ncbi:MAG: sulfatase [Verrucomicrobia bacterium]|nr:sulfatase [Verrucomicrobiota bacterium]MDA1340245.1 sulfatase [Verrucomicrobiota bacterium]
MKHTLITLLASTIFCLCPAAVHSAEAKSKPNILFIASDDLKPMLGCYGDTVIKTPNIDRLASHGTVFLNAHCQQAICGPTRASLLTGLRPDSTGIYDLKAKIRTLTPDVVTLPQYFKENGYQSVGLGKIFDPRNVEGYAKDDPQSWSRPYVQVGNNKDSALGFLDPAFVAKVRAAAKEKGLKENQYDALSKAVGGKPVAEINQDVPDSAYQDGAMAVRAVALMGELAKGPAPFFLAVGFQKPHLPFVAPKKYGDLYQDSDIRLEQFQKMPEGAPDFAFQPGWELRNGSYAGYTSADDSKESPIPEDRVEEQKRMIHGYMACVSYLDAQVGLLLDALEKNGVADNTIVVFWGDHGWHFGDHGLWCKHTNYEQATRSPLIIARRATGGKEQKSASPVEFVDIYPTLCDLAGLPISPQLQGISLAPILDDASVKVKEFAVSQYPRGQGPSELMGYAFRDGRYRYVEWVPKGQPNAEPKATELYDYETDPLERKNLASDPAQAEVLAKMKKMAREFHERNPILHKS